MSGFLNIWELAGIVRSRERKGLLVAVVAGVSVSKKKAPSFTWGPKTTRECCPYSKNRVKFDSNESAGLPTPEQPTRLAEESARPTRLYPTKSRPFSASLPLSHTVFIGVDLLNRQSQDVKPKKSKL